MRVHSRRAGINEVLRRRFRIPRRKRKKSGKDKPTLCKVEKADKVEKTGGI